MENATKALLIAAAVLVAILIISIGLIIYNRASETVNTAGDLSEYQIQQFNSKFTEYEGTNVSGADVNALLKTVFNHNISQNDLTKIIAVGLDFDENEAGGIWLIYREGYNSFPRKTSLQRSSCWKEIYSKS